MARNKSFGIDFGTTNSSAARYESYHYRTTGGGMTDGVVPYDEGGRPIPSVVAIDKRTGEVHTGLDAWERRAELEDTCECISSIKSVLDDERWSKTIAGREWTAVDVASEVFVKLREVAMKQQADMDVATLAMPVGLKPAARRTIRKAASYAGIKVESFVSEPTAAFFAYYDDLMGAERVVVFDWGGGTLDVSVLRHSRGRVTELATKGMKFAGDDIDLEIAERIHSFIAREKGMQIAFEDMDARSRDALVVRSERAKRLLSERGRAVVALNRYGNEGNIRRELSFDWFEEVMCPIVNRAMGCVDLAIAQAGTTDAGIDRVLLVGGSSNLKPLRARMEVRFGDRLYFPGDEGWSVSRGAALLSYAPGAYVAAQDVSIILADGTPYYLLRVGDRVDGWRRSVEFGVTDASQTLRIVFSGSADIDEDEERLRLTEVRGYGFLEEKLILEAEVDPELVFRVKVRSNMRPGRDAKIWEYDRLKLSYGMGEWGR